ncbi:MAG: winged helix-turn-helix domain-containing protein [Pseudomonadota bacterium]|nr:winged helix-turn-helix domain-containing protein [Pseudomonadota bacterium]
MSAVLRMPQAAMNLRGLVIEDDEHLRETLCSVLAAIGIDARGVDRERGKQELGVQRLSAIGAVTATLSDRDDSIAAALSAAPATGMVLIMTGDATRPDETVSADGRCVVMPVNRQALESALSRLHERLSPPDADFAGGACWTFDTARWTLLAPNGRTAQLSLAEAQLVRCLFERQGEVASREDLLTALNRPQMESFRRNLDVTVSRLRKKVESLCRVRLPLAAARGQGYAFNATVEFTG